MPNVNHVGGRPTSPAAGRRSYRDVLRLSTGTVRIAERVRLLRPRCERAPRDQGIAESPAAADTDTTDTKPGQRPPPLARARKREAAVVLRSFVGAPVKRKEDPRLITGSSVYVDDLSLPGMLHLAIVRSPYAHATITGIDTEAALAMPGVEAVATAADLASVLASKYPVEAYEGPGDRPEDQIFDEEVDDSIAVPGVEPLASRKVRYIGEPVAAVVARLQDAGRRRRRCGASRLRPSARRRRSLRCPPTGRPPPLRRRQRQCQRPPGDRPWRRRRRARQRRNPGASQNPRPPLPPDADGDPRRGRRPRPHHPRSDHLDLQPGPPRLPQRDRQRLRPRPEPGPRHRPRGRRRLRLQVRRLPRGLHRRRPGLETATARSSGSRPAASTSWPPTMAATSGASSTSPPTPKAAFRRCGRASSSTPAPIPRRSTSPGAPG